MPGSHTAPIDSQLLPVVELPPGYDNFVLLMAATKGGVGKSTLAINLAVAAAQCGLQSLIVDADSAGEQVSCFNWFEKLRVKGAAGPKVIRAAIANVENAINWGKSKGYQVIVVDTGGYDLPSLPRLLDLSDFMLTPALPSPLDLEATAPIRRVWRTSATPASVVLNGIGNENTARAQRYRDRHAATGKILSLMVSRRVQYVDAIASGMGVSEYLPGGLGDFEMRNLLSAVFVAGSGGGRS